MLKNNLFSNTTLTYSVTNLDDAFNGTYVLTTTNIFGNKIKYGNVIWSGNTPTNKNDLNFVIHGYLNPHLTYENLLIPDGLFIGTTWFHNKNLPSGISVTNCIGTMYNKTYIVSIKIIPNDNKYDIVIILTNINMLQKYITLFCVLFIILVLIFYKTSKNSIHYLIYILGAYVLGIFVLT
jgi:hypothetical protein